MSIDGIDAIGLLFAGPEGFVSLRGLLVQSSNLFGISSVHFSSLDTYLSGKFVQFSSGHRGKRLSSVRSVQFVNSSGPGSLVVKMDLL